MTAKQKKVKQILLHTVITKYLLTLFQTQASDKTGLIVLFKQTRVMSNFSQIGREIHYYVYLEARL